MAASPPPPPSPCPLTPSGDRSDDGAAVCTDDDEDTLRRVMKIFDAKTGDFGYAGHGNDSESSSDDECSASDDIAYLRRIQEQFLPFSSVPAVSRIPETPPIAKPIRSLPPPNTDDEEDFVTLRPIQRRFAIFGGVDDSNDIWGEDEALQCDANDFSSDSFVLEREWERRHNQFHTIGYRDGISAGKEASAQEGFNEGYKQSVYAGYSWGLVCGIFSVMSSFQDQLKEKLTCNSLNKDRFELLSESTRAVSSNDALQIFYSSMPQNCSGNSSTPGSEVSSCNQLDSLFNDLNHLLCDSPDIKVDLVQINDSAFNH